MCRTQTNSSDPIIGLGSKTSRLFVYLPHTPPDSGFEHTPCYRPAKYGELHSITERTGNHWRKIFNIAAKLGFYFQKENTRYTTWQNYRDQLLCQEGQHQEKQHQEKQRQEGSIVALIFSSKRLLSQDGIHIVSGHQYCQALCPQARFEQIDADFAVDWQHKVIDSPYFDYRQLSNIKLEKLCSLIQELQESARFS